MNAAQIADQAINKIEAEEAGLVPPADDSKKGDDAKGGDNDKPKDTPKDGAKPADDDSNKDGGADDKDAKPKADDDKPGEFTADDAVEVEAPKAEEPKAPTDNAGVVLSQGEQKYIADNIGEPIVIRGIRGDKTDIIEIKAYSPADIPADFKFANDRELATAQTGFYSMEQRANKLLGDYRNNQSQATAQDYEKRENEGIKADVADLQKDGRFPKFRVRPGEAGFDDTPEAKQMSEVLQLMAERNQTYLKQYEQGRPYKHIGFSEAFELWEKSNPGKQAEKKANDAQKDEDEERKKAAERGDSNRGTTASNIRKPTVRPGTTTRDILARIEAEE